MLHITFHGGSRLRPPPPPPLHPSSPPSGELHATSALRGSLWNVIQLYGVPEKMSRIVKLLHSDTQCCVRPSPPRGGVLSVMAYTGRLLPKGVPFSNIGKTTTTNQCRRVPDLWRPGSVKIKRYYTKNGRLIPTAKRGKEIKQP